MADLFLPPLAPVTPEPTAVDRGDLAVDSSSGRFGSFDIRHQSDIPTREVTLQTPAPLRICQDQDNDSQDPTLSWVCSLPSPFTTFNEFGEAFPHDYEINAEIAAGAEEAQSFRAAGNVETVTATLANKTNEGEATQQRAENVVNLKTSNGCPDDTVNRRHIVIKCHDEKERVRSRVGLVPPSKEDTRDRQTTLEGNNVMHFPSQKSRGGTPTHVSMTNEEYYSNTLTPSLYTKSPALPHNTRKRPIDKNIAQLSSDAAAKRRMQDENFDTARPIVVSSPATERASSVESYCSNYSDLMSPSVTPTPRMMRDIVRRYLKKRDEMKIIILHAKVVQKSYGTEKRTLEFDLYYCSIQKKPLSSEAQIRLGCQSVQFHQTYNLYLSPGDPTPFLMSQLGMAIAEYFAIPECIRISIPNMEELRIHDAISSFSQISWAMEFFCPPPCVHLVGNGWKTKQRRKNVSSSPSPTPSPGGMSVPSPGIGSKASDVYAFIGVGGGENELQQLHLDANKSYAAAKNLHTPDTDKRKHFELHVKMFYGDGTEIGRFLSRRIKVISKPSKKKQSVKNPELCIASGSKVSFFNRLRSQTVSTRYLFATRTGYCASATQWGAFSIYLAKDDEKEGNSFDTLDGYIHYGKAVKLVCSVTGIALPKIVIRKVDKQDAIIDTDEPLSQLHRCAMFLYDTKRQYLGLVQDKVVAHTARPSSKNANKDCLNDGSCWTIISTEKAEYCWSDSSLHLVNSIPVTPVPVVYSLQINGGGEMSMVELIGENFTPDLTLWFSTVEANTMYRCEECLICIVPEINKLKPDWKYVKETVKVPLVLVRDDGLIYPTHIDFYYTPEPGPKAASNPSIREILRNKAFLS